VEPMSECCAVNKPVPIAPSIMNCPVSGTPSKRVDLITVKSLVRHLKFVMPATQYYFCTVPGCEVVYFPSNPEAPIFSRDDLLVPVGAKDSGEEATICYCFGITRGQIHREVEETGRCLAGGKIKAAIQSGRCACEVKNPSGKCCLGEVTRAVLEDSKNSRSALTKD
jgi:Zinc binding domain